MVGKTISKKIALLMTVLLMAGSLQLPVDTSANISDGVKRMNTTKPTDDIYNDDIILTYETESAATSNRSLKSAAVEETVTTKEEADINIEQALDRMDEILGAGGTFYGYERLTESQQCIYSKLYSTCVDFAVGGANAPEEIIESEVRYLAGSFDVETASDHQIQQVWTAFRADHGEFYWLSSTCRCSYTLSESDEYEVNAITIYAYPEYALAKDRKSADIRIRNGAQEYLDLLAKTPDMYEKVRILHDMIILRADYAYEEDGETASKESKAHNIDGLFDSENSEVVCEGYTKGFQFVANIAGIPNIYVIGMADGGNHAWNLVSFDKGNTYYPLDLTWDDMGSEKGMFEIQYIFFALDRESFFAEHTPGTPDGEWGEDKWYVETPETAEDKDHTYFAHYQSVVSGDMIGDKERAGNFVKRAAALSPNPEVVLFLCPQEYWEGFCSMFPGFQWMHISLNNQGMKLLYLVNANMMTQIPVISYKFQSSGEEDSDGAIVINGEAGEQVTLNLEQVMTASGEASDDYIRLCVDDESMSTLSENVLLAVNGESVTITFLQSGTVRLYSYLSSEIASYAADIMNSSQTLPGGTERPDATDDPNDSTSGNGDDNGNTTQPQPTNNPATDSAQWTDTKTQAVYRVLTGVKGNQVEYVKTSNKKAVKAVIPSTVKRDGTTYRVTGIGANAWKGCKKVKTLTIGKNVTRIGQKAFYGCSNLKKITVNTTEITSGKIGKNVFKGVSSKAKVKVPKKKKAPTKKCFVKQD